jgi:hypothetical protein
VKRGGQFEWDDQNAGHIALHNVTPDEVEQVIANDPISLEVAIRKGRTAYPMRWLDGPRAAFSRWFIRCATARFEWLPRMKIAGSGDCYEKAKRKEDRPERDPRESRPPQCAGV